MKMKRPFLTTRRLALLALLSALSVVGRVLLTPLPNVQPMTALLLIITLTMSEGDGLIVATLSLLLSNLLLGLGPWTLFQWLSFSGVILLTARVGRYGYHPQQWRSRFIMAGWAGVSGFLYGGLISLFTVWFYQLPSFWGYYLVGVPFDSLHAAGNVVFYLLLEPLLAPIIRTRLAAFQ